MNLLRVLILVILILIVFLLCFSFVSPDSVFVVCPFCLIPSFGFHYQGQPPQRKKTPLPEGSKGTTTWEQEQTPLP